MIKETSTCKKFGGIVRADDGDKVLLAHVRCKMWSCPYCAVKNAQQWRAALIDYINNSTHTHWSFLTITMPSWVRKLPKAKRYDASARIIKENWDKFQKRLKRMFGKFQYVRVLEEHKDSTLHVHYLMSAKIPDVRHVVRKDGSKYGYNKELKAHAVACGFGHICDHRNLESDNVAWHAGAVASYVTKYITKDLAGNEQTLKNVGVRKIQTSRGIKRVSSDAKHDWQFVGRYTVGAFTDDLRENKITFDVTLKQNVTPENFVASSIYPRDFEYEEKNRDTMP